MHQKKCLHSVVSRLNWPRRLRRVCAKIFFLNAIYGSQRHPSGLKRALRATTGVNDTKEQGMSMVRVLVGTRKGAFILTSEATRARWEVSGPLFGGWEL